MKRKDNFTYEQHQEIAKRLAVIFEGIYDLSQYLDGCHQADAPTAKASLAAQRKIGKLGRAANLVQSHFEGLLSQDDGNDRRSWALYFPQQKPAMRIHYA